MIRQNGNPWRTAAADRRLWLYRKQSLWQTCLKRILPRMRPAKQRFPDLKDTQTVYPECPIPFKQEIKQ